MKKVSISLGTQQYLKLQHVVRATGLSMGEIIRRILDEGLNRAVEASREIQGESGK